MGPAPISGRGYLGDAGRPKAGGQQIAHEQGLPVAHTRRDGGQALVRVGHPHIFGQAAVDPAAQRPPAVRVDAVVHIALPAEKALAAKGFHIHGDPVAGGHCGHSGARLLHKAHQLVAHRDAGHRPGHAAVFDVQVAGADAGQAYPHDRIPRVQQNRLWLFQQAEPAGPGVGIS